MGDTFVCSRRTIWSTEQRAYSSYICAWYWDKTVEGHALFTSPLVCAFIKSWSKDLRLLLKNIQWHFVTFSLFFCFFYFLKNQPFLC